MSPSEYHSYRDLPPLAGIAGFAEAARPGLSVEDCVARLKRHHWAFRRLHGIFIGRLTAEPVYELKTAFSLHAHYCAEHAAAWRVRVGEMREPPLGLDAAPDAELDAFFNGIRAAPDTPSLIVGIYGLALPGLRSALIRHIAETNRLVDHPSFRICRFALIEVEEMVVYGREAMGRLMDDAVRDRLAAWKRDIAVRLRACGGIDGSDPAGPVEAFGAEKSAVGCAEGAARAVMPPAETTAPVSDWRYDPVPRRDERFSDPYNMGVHAEAFLYSDAYPPGPKTLMMYYKRLREIDVPEVMAGILAETSGKPWTYARDMTRQLWDEARHAMMGEVGFVRAGIDWRKFVRVNLTWSLALNTQLRAIERHAVLYYIEQGLMPKSGKRFEWEIGVASGDPFSALCQDYDWADEVLHARIGRDWYVKAIGDSERAVAYGDECWSRVLVDWRGYRNRGLTSHMNWWPELYREWCRVRGEVPDERVLGFRTTYESARTDLAEIAPASG